MSDSEKQTEAIGELRDHRGRFLPGNPSKGGRPKGSRHKLQEKFFRDMQEIWEAHGAGVLQAVLAEKPGDLMRTVAGLMPKEVSVEVVDAETALRELDDGPATPALPDSESGSQPDTSGASGTLEGQP